MAATLDHAEVAQSAIQELCWLHHGIYHEDLRAQCCFSPHGPTAQLWVLVAAKRGSTDDENGVQAWMYIVGMH